MDEVNITMGNYVEEMHHLSIDEQAISAFK